MTAQRPFKPTARRWISGDTLTRRAGWFGHTYQR